MNRIGLLSTALGTALLLGGPALAQSGAQSGAIGEMQRERTNPAVPSVPLQDRNAAEADRLALREPTQWLQQAQEALQSNRLGEANELLERAETRLLSRSTAPDMARMPASNPMLDRITAARQELAQRNRMGAQRELGAALALAPQFGNGTLSGADTGTPGLMQGGGTTNGRATLQDQGTAGRSMARADIIMAQQSAPVDQLRGGNPAPAVPSAGARVETPRGAPPAGSLSPPGASTTGREMNPDDAARRVGPSGVSPQGAPAGGGGGGGGGAGGGSGGGG